MENQLTPNSSIILEIRDLLENARKNAAQQVNMYLNYYAAEVNGPDDNPPIGIILCAEKDSIAAEYALGGLSNNIFASRYVLYQLNRSFIIGKVCQYIKHLSSLSTPMKNFTALIIRIQTMRAIIRPERHFKRISGHHGTTNGYIRVNI